MQLLLVCDLPGGMIAVAYTCLLAASAFHQALQQGVVLFICSIIILVHTKASWEPCVKSVHHRCVLLCCRLADMLQGVVLSFSSSIVQRMYCLSVCSIST
jgi:hypothetical protein